MGLVALHQDRFSFTQRANTPARLPPPAWYALRVRACQLSNEPPQQQMWTAAAAIERAGSSDLDKLKLVGFEISYIFSAISTLMHHAGACPLQRLHL
jgi:hypothetical protein